MEPIQTSESPFEMSPRLPWLMRAALLTVGATLVGLLATAFMLEPSQAGLGTHQQLGLPPCTLRMIAGIRCPSCGMTTSWSHITKGHVVRAFEANTGGALLAIGAATVGPYMCISALKGRWFVREPNELYFALGGAAIIVITLIDWGCRLYFG